MHWGELAGRVLPILGFLVCITVVAELADRIGVFDAVAQVAARLAGTSVLRLWLLVVVVAVLATAVLSLDTTAVLLTPVVLALARRHGLDQGLFAMTAVWLANTASLFLPVSNLTNLLAHSALPGRTVLDFVRLLWPAALTTTLLTVGVLALLFRNSLRGRYDPVPAVPAAHPNLLRLGLLVCAALGPAFVLGVNVVVAAAGGAAILVVACLVADRSLLSWQLLPAKLVLGVAGLFLVVQYAGQLGLVELGKAAAGSGTGWVALLRLSSVAAVAANVVDNLPAYLALEPAVAGEPVRLAALLLGVNAGSVITPWASLATLLWAARCRSAGVTITWRRFAWRGLILVPLAIGAAVTALWARN